MTSTRQLVDEIKSLLPEQREEDAARALMIGAELLGRAVIALEDIAHHFNAKGVYDPHDHAPSYPPEGRA